MTIASQPAEPVVIAGESTPATRRVNIESEAIYWALSAGVAGAIIGIVVAWGRTAPFWGEWPSLGGVLAIGSAVAAAAAAATGYTRSGRLPGQEWRHDLSRWRVVVNTISVTVTHAALAALATAAIYMVFSLGFVGLLLRSFEGGILAAVTVGLAAYITYLSSARITTQWLSNLLLAFVALGMLTAMATSTDQGWWRVHFSQLGTFDSFSSVVFNGTLMAGGLLVTTFAAYIQSDIRRLVARQRLRSERVATAIPVMFVIMGIMFAGVGVFPCDVYPVLHVISASGMAVVFLVLLISSRWLLVGMPRAFFLSELALGAALIAAVVLFVVGFFSLTGVEIGIFALIFGWITVFIRFLGVTGKEA